MKQLFPALLCVALVGLLAACSAAPTGTTPAGSAPLAGNATPAPTDEAEQPAPESATPSEQPTAAPTPAVLTIACSGKGYNPYLTSDTLVKQTSTLLFENFVEIAPDFTLDYRLAQEIVSSGTTVTITLRTCSFADGAPITTEDALQSLLTAAQSDAYRDRFANLLEASATETQLTLTLARPDSLFAYLLDIPIMKASDLASAAPTASGRYTYGSDGTTLAANPFACFATDGPDRILLIPVTSYDDMISALSLGEINYTMQGEGSTSESSITAGEHYYKTNTQLFLGVNAHAPNPLCNTPTGRILLSHAIDRDQLAIDAYAARAYAARGALNPFYPAAKDSQTILSVADTSTLAADMAILGYSYNQESSYYQNEKDERAHVSILLHTGNSNKTLLASELATEWAKYGIEAAIQTAPDFNSFLTLLESGEFELYIGELKLYNNIELSSFWAGNASYGVAPSEALLQQYGAFRADASTAAAFEEAFAAEMPYIPLLWKNGVVLTSRGSSGVSASVSNQFYSFGGLSLSESQNQKE